MIAATTAATLALFFAALALGREQTSAPAILAVVGRQVAWLNLEAPRHRAVSRLPATSNALEVTAQPDSSNGESDNSRADRIEHADIAVPTALLLASAGAYRLRQLASRWWRRSHNKKEPLKRPHPSGLGPGPRSFRKKTGATSVQKPCLKR